MVVALALAAVLGVAGVAAAQDNTRQAPVRADLVAKLTGKRIHRDAATGQVRAITADEASDLVTRLAASTRRTTAEPAQTGTLRSGLQMLRTDGFMHVMLARPNADGSTSTRCVSTVDEGVAFLSGEINGDR